MGILDFIAILNEGSGYIETIFTKGGCYKFHLILKKLYPDSLAYINSQKDHIITKHNGLYYDVSGEVSGIDYELLKDNDLELVKSWSFETMYVLSVMECPYCEEPLLF